MLHGRAICIQTVAYLVIVGNNLSQGHGRCIDAKVCYMHRNRQNMPLTRQSFSIYRIYQRQLAVFELLPRQNTEHEVQCATRDMRWLYFRWVLVASGFDSKA